MKKAIQGPVSPCALLVTTYQFVLGGSEYSKPRLVIYLTSYVVSSFFITQLIRFKIFDYNTIGIYDSIMSFLPFLCVCRQYNKLCTYNRSDYYVLVLTIHIRLSCFSNWDIS